MSQHSSASEKSLGSINMAPKLESQQAADAPHEYNISASRKIVCLSLYFLLALGLTLSNKVVLRSAQFPWLLTATHATATSVGCLILHQMGYFRWTRLSTKDNLALVAFSCLFTANIATSNLSLGLVSVPFHQVLRSTVPVVTILIYRWCYGRSYSRQTSWTMIPLVGGVGLATFGDYHFNVEGFLLTSLGVLLAATKSVVGNRLMTGNLSLPALEILLRMSPLAAAQSLICALASGELRAARQSFARGHVFTSDFAAMLATNASMAFALNGMSFYTNKITGALTVSVCANLSQVLTILTSIVLFNVPVSPLHGIGMLIALVGAAWYSKAEMDAKRDRIQTSPKR